MLPGILGIEIHITQQYPVQDYPFVKLHLYPGSFYFTYGCLSP